MNRLILMMGLLLLSPNLLAQNQPQPLRLNEVVDAALRAFPSLLASEQRKQVAAGDLQTAQGGFDTQLKSQNRWSIIGLYENQNLDVSFEQPTALGGTTFFGGWRRGNGDYPIYDGKAQTANDGEARIGVNIPLWRNREIDRRRASLQQAELGQLIANHEYDQALLDLRRQASHRYWDWLLAGQRLNTANQLLKVAEARNDGIKQRVAAGDIPEFEALDNQRAILERRERQVQAQRLLEQAAIQLSLYWRDEDGQPQLPTAELLPQDFPQQTPNVEPNYQQALQQAQNQRPELKRLGLQAQQTETEYNLQDNQRNPGLDLMVMAANDMGEAKQKLNRDELYMGVNIDFALQQRVAGGRAQAAAANLQRLKWERIAMQDRVNAEVKDVYSALNAARQRLILSQQQQQAAQQLEDGERSRFDLGDSTLLFVNLREIAAGDARLQAAEAATSLFKAHADYQAIVAESLPESQQ